MSIKQTSNEKHLASSIARQNKKRENRMSVLFSQCINALAEHSELKIGCCHEDDLLDSLENFVDATSFLGLISLDYKEYGIIYDVATWPWEEDYPNKWFVSNGDIQSGELFNVVGAIQYIDKYVYSKKYSEISQAN